MRRAEGGANIFGVRPREPRSGQTKDYIIGICWLGIRNQYNLSEWGDRSTRGLLFIWPSTMQIQLLILYKNGYHYYLNDQSLPQLYFN